MRGVNAVLPATHKVRVLLGDPPIEWENVKTQEEHRRWIEMRDTFPADLIQREVVAKGRHALLTYGSMHFQRKNLIANHESEGPAETIVSRLENKWGAKVFTIFTADVSSLQPDAASWPSPSLAIIRGTKRGLHEVLPVGSDGPVPDQGWPTRFLGADSGKSSGRPSARKISLTPSSTPGQGSPPRVDLDPGALRREGRVRGVPPVHGGVRCPAARGRAAEEDSAAEEPMPGGGA